MGIWRGRARVCVFFVLMIRLLLFVNGYAGICESRLQQTQTTPTTRVEFKRPSRYHGIDCFLLFSIQFLSHKRPPQMALGLDNLLVFIVVDHTHFWSIIFSLPSNRFFFCFSNFGEALIKTIKSICCLAN